MLGNGKSSSPNGQVIEQHCARGHWHETQQALVTNKNRQYDVLTLSCADGTTKKLYLDITSFFGKMSFAALFIRRRYGNVSDLRVAR